MIPMNRVCELATWTHVFVRRRGHVASCDLIDSDFYPRYQQHAAYSKPFQGYGNFITCYHLLCKNTNFFLLVFSFSFHSLCCCVAYLHARRSLSPQMQMPIFPFDSMWRIISSTPHNTWSAEIQCATSVVRRWQSGTVARRTHRYAKLPSVTQQKSYWRQRVQALSPIFLLFSPFHSFALVRFYK